MKKKIRVFTTNCGAHLAGTELTDLFDKWERTGNFEVISFHTNSNKFGWSLTILYKVIE